MKEMNTKVHKIRTTGFVSRFTIVFAGLATLIYFGWWLDFSNAGNVLLYTLLVVGEIFHVWQALGYAFTVWDQKKLPFEEVENPYGVDVFITVCGEPVDIVERTVKAAKKIDYPNFQVYVLNDGKAANKDNWEEINAVAIKHGAIPITRDNNKGFKAGNVNNALAKTSNPFVVIFDADHVPQPNFLSRTMGYFKNPKLALVQTPQYYANKDENFITRASWEQQELFFGPICEGKNKSNATFWCGTNAVVRREALESIGGVPENNIAEDFLASLFMHQKGWRTLYVPEVLAKGLAPHNLGDYITQQFRWARGSLEVIFKYNPLFKRGLTWYQKVQYLYSSSYYLNGVVVIIDALIPILALGFNVLPVNAQTSDFMIFFFPFIFSTIYLLMTSTRHQITFEAIQLSMSSFFVFFTATISALLGIKVKFQVTSKSKTAGNYLKFVVPHAAYVIISIVVITKAVMEHGLVPSVVTNAAWAIFNVAFFSGYLRAAYPWKELYIRLTNPSLLPESKTRPAVAEKKLAWSFIDSKQKEEYEE
jgi:cellulose synthase (UDP-forming)